MSLGCLPLSRPLALATFTPSRVRSRIRSDSNSATVARTLNSRQATDGVGGVLDRPTEAQADLAGGELIGDRPSIGQGPGQSVEFGDHQGVAGPAGRKLLAQSRSPAFGAGQAVTDVDPLGLCAETEEGLALRGEVLLIRRASALADKQCAHGAPPSGVARRPGTRDGSGIGTSPDTAIAPPKCDPYATAQLVEPLGTSSRELPLSRPGDPLAATREPTEVIVMATRNVVLSQHQHELVKALVKSGRYQNASEVMREGLRLLERQEAEESAKTAVLRRAAEEGWADLASGRFVDVNDESLDDLIGELGARASEIRSAD